MDSKNRLICSPAALCILGKRKIGVADEPGECRNFAKQLALFLWIVSEYCLSKYAAGFATRLPDCKGAG